jgi:hypothetical protein
MYNISFIKESRWPQQPNNQTVNTTSNVLIASKYHAKRYRISADCVLCCDVNTEYGSMYCVWRQYKI